MKRKKTHFEPEWRTTPPEPGSWRSIFKWGAPDGFKHPNAKLYALLKETFGLTDESFNTPVDTGDGLVTLSGKAPAIAPETVDAFTAISGKENVSVNDYDRVKYSTGKTMEEIYALRDGKPDNVADLIIHPRIEEEISQIVTLCHEQKIPLHIFGGGSSVTLGLAPKKGGVTLVMATHMTRVVEFNETNQTITVECGIMGPALEELLNNAPNTFNTKHPYTCGHFPQSFEYSTVGGWIAAKGSGQQSSYYGDAVDLVLGQTCITPTGTVATLDYPSTATGPMVNDILKGGEGAYGVLTRATLKVFRHTPETRKRFSFIFPTWKDAVNATREISQAECGMPSVFRISDPEETYIGLKQHGIEGTILDTFMTKRGYKPGQRCLLLGHTEGEKGFSKNVCKQVKRIAKANGAMSLTGYPVTLWQHGRFNDPYLREDLNDYGVVIDTLETGVKWDNLHQVHMGVRQYIKKRPDTLCMTHCSHIYPQGTNLYFIFIGTFKSREEFVSFHRGIIESIEANGGTLSHHHGVGRMMGPYMEKHLGKGQMNTLKALKNHFDPHNIMNPGGTLGLDDPTES
ncbi:oxidoreductase [Desulfoluna limicola]|uniref:Oxidoreductase n=1 Tax=Desulfoluna limicola TaxID=2810562 RepID=A0ABM7PFG5_9BACT|nr:FAD-binding oxidoreductase [Desulfoluna limicola]BCS96307.1 oxidoreductase [Desulfoluna limicola]